MKTMRLSKGQGLVEYALLIGLIVIGTVLTLQLTGVRLSDVYCRAASAFAARACAEA
ncbi:MAG: hypothetical protein Kow0070_26750 [Anaerolineales bacterium]